MEHILEIKDLHTYFYMEDSVIKAVEGITLSVRKGEVLGLVGESACGKTVAAYSIMRLIQPPGNIVKGEVFFESQNLLSLKDEQMRRVRGTKISMVFQEPMAALNPLYTVGFQVGEALKFHKSHLRSREIKSTVIELLEKVGISNPASRAKDYPHNLSGGQAQRVVIAMAMASHPSLVIADEPTTSLDVTIQAQVMDLFMHLKQEQKFTFILITHNLALCSQVADRIAIMYAGRIVEIGVIEEIFDNALHPYTKALFASIPQGEAHKEKLKVIEGVVPDPSDKPPGCHFHPRCPIKKEVCEKKYPQLIEIKAGHWVSCHRAREFL